MKLFPLLAVTAAIFVSCSKPQTAELFPQKRAKDVNPDTHLILKFSSTPSVGSNGLIRIHDASTGAVVDSLDLSIPAGPVESRSYGPECDYTKVPYDFSPRKVIPTNRDTEAGTPSGTAGREPETYQLDIIGGFTDGFHFYPVLVRGDSAVIYPHHNILEYGHSYYVTIDEGAITTADGSFKGISGRQWKFSTKKSAPSNPRHLVVDASGKGDFNTVQGVLDFLPDADTAHTLIEILPGDYEEIVYARSKSNFTIKGAGMDRVRIHYANNEVFNPHPLLVKTNEKEGSFPSRRAAFSLDHCRDFTLEGFTVATDCQGQAEGLLLNAEHAALYNVRIIGDGDALQANGTIYMENCELDGGGDTILGRGSLYAYRCRLHNHGGPLTWVRNEAPAHGDVLVECEIYSDSDYPIDYGRSQFNHGFSYPDAEVVLIDCKVRNLAPEGWSGIDWQTNTMLEYGTTDLDTGEKADVTKRHRFSSQLDAVRDAEVIEEYKNPAFVLGGWKPDEKSSE